MSLPTALVLQAQGTNRDLDVIQALRLAGANAESVPLTLLSRGDRRWRDYQLLVLPGGFSYADALGAGKLLAIDLISYFVEEITGFIDSGKPVIGICNGFQALVKSGILPDGKKRRGDGGVKATLTFNARGHFECRWVTLAPVSQTCVWTKGLDELFFCPIAHGEGNFQTRNKTVIETLSALDQIALTYVHEDGKQANGDYPANPNGSLLDIAGICNPQGNVLGLMPHLENHIYDWQHPLAARGGTKGNGLVLFAEGVKYAKQL